jgi:methylenetetrahydrofolate dehydrogenase (NADP+)/methenyltetrahydrofolate cyclohydrolase
VIIDGKKIAEEIIASLGDSLKGKKLGIVVGIEDPATLSFVKIKTRIAERLGVEVERGELSELVNTCDGIIVQLPHPKAEELIAAIPPEKDLDAIGKNPIVRTPVAEAISEVLSRAGVAAAGKKVVVVGKGRLVGAPAAELLKDLGAQVTVVTQTQGSLDELRDADIVVLGAGEPGLVGPDMIKEGVVLIDAGTSEAGGKLTGDAQPGCARVASVFTPVPGGIGPIAVAMIFKNLYELARRR